MRSPLTAFSLAFFTMVAACASAPPRDETPPTGTTTTTTTVSLRPTSEPEAPLTSCPATFGEAMKRASGTWGMPPCQYPEGRCDVVEPAQCGGVEMPPPVRGQRVGFACRPSDPNATKADGCPYDAPVDKAGCFKNGVGCSYGECSWSQTVATCVANQWKVEQHMSPPPP